MGNTQNKIFSCCVESKENHSNNSKNAPRSHRKESFEKELKDAVNERDNGHYKIHQLGSDERLRLKEDHEKKKALEDEKKKDDDQKKDIHRSMAEMVAAQALLRTQRLETATAAS